MNYPESNDKVATIPDRSSDAVFAKAYRELEGLIGDLHNAYRLSELADGDDENLRNYAHTHLGDIVKKLYDGYYATYAAFEKPTP